MITNSEFVYLPAEFHLQSGVQLTWPHALTDWHYSLDEADALFIKIAAEIAKREIVLIVSYNPEELRKRLTKYVNMENVRFAKADCNDTWARDHGAITVMDNGFPVLMDFTFNGWGLKFAANLDNQITRNIYSGNILNGKYESHLDFVLEGGSIESDGMGTILTTSECLLSPNRNPRMNKQQIEDRLKKVFNAKRILWLDHGYLAGDDTDSHIDTLARFCSPDTIAYVKCTNQSDEHYNALLQMEEQLKSFRTLDGEPYKLIPLPMADEIFDFDKRLPATYANFLIMNEAVLYPTYNQPANDETAKKALESAFPGREIVGIDCCLLIEQHGSLHCVTMQYPEGVLK